MKQKVTISIFS